MSHTEKHLQTREHILNTARPLIGARGFSAVGLSQILEAAKIPKGSFYHYFDSKEHFGEALLGHYLEAYFAKADAFFHSPGKNGFERVMAYCQWWQDTHLNGSVGDKCLIVKLAAEVCDLSERMRHILEEGTKGVVARLERVVEEGQRDGSIQASMPSLMMANTLYHMWLGATLMMKITRDAQPFSVALTATQRLMQ